ncbi:hypothetical protein [Chryseosolibacter indicus]|uniref:Lipoprotein n=1 Tax=Chryseosolibacter indicus TaxID=2782351 RepID=A0ABS5VU05_9BACT|nr:hypothetical protein [Chryseosolibacter indicus]MBT1703471.1 hypothetical protein [Chryseosolibacter indicus]
MYKTRSYSGADLVKTAIALKHFFKYLALIPFFLSACGSDETDSQPEKGFDYYPLTKGFYQIYDVEETKYSEVADPETLLYQLKHEVVDSFANDAAGITYVVYREKREDEGKPWVYVDTWSVRVNGNDIIVSEGNVPFVKLAVPLKKGRKWDGNKYNNLEPDQYEINSIEKTYEVGDEVFQEVAVVEQEFEDDPIVYTDLREEAYAKSVGLVYREITQLHYCTDEFCLNDQIIESGVRLKQTIREYGRK